ncbi:MAG: hypothetical protein IPM06_14340 [Rhizobiales bacterium]|nr:hypothetical protein [Hyphomicrobiales bacterium]
MSEMSPLARVLITILHRGAAISAVLLVAIAGLMLWQRWTPQGLVFESGDKGFLAVIGLLLLLALYLVWGIRRELTHPGGK